MICISKKIFNKKSKSLLLIISLTTSLFISIFLYTNTALCEETHHYCDDIEQWQVWSNLVHKFPDDDNVAIGYALRIGLCEQIKTKTIETERAIKLFDRYMQALQNATALEELKAYRLENKEGV